MKGKPDAFQLQFPTHLGIGIGGCGYVVVYSLTSQLGGPCHYRDRVHRCYGLHFIRSCKYFLGKEYGEGVWIVLVGCDQYPACAGLISLSFRSVSRGQLPLLPET